jgi:hypothetical protein
MSTAKLFAYEVDRWEGSSSYGRVSCPPVSSYKPAAIVGRNEWWDAACQQKKHRFRWMH